MFLNVSIIVFADIDIDFVAILNNVFFAAINIPSGSFITAWCSSIAFARNDGVLHACIDILMHVFICLYMCIDMHMQSNDDASTVQDNDHRSILYIAVRLINKIVFLSKLEPSSSGFSKSINNVLPTCICDNDNSFAGRSVHIRSGAISDIKHNTDFYFVNNVRISNIGVLFDIVTCAVIAVVVFVFHTL